MSCGHNYFDCQWNEISQVVAITQQLLIGDALKDYLFWRRGWNHPRLSGVILGFSVGWFVVCFMVCSISQVYGPAPHENRPPVNQMPQVLHSNITRWILLQKHIWDLSTVNRFGLGHTQVNRRHSVCLIPGLDQPTSFLSPSGSGGWNPGRASTDPGGASPSLRFQGLGVGTQWRLGSQRDLHALGCSAKSGKGIPWDIRSYV